VAGISAKDVKALRERTGAGMMDCKGALSDAEGDVERAIELLRERGLAKAGKKAGRATSEGAIAISVAGGAAGIVDLGCETDFVAKTDDFQALAQQVAGVVAGDAAIQNVEQALAAPLEGGTVADKINAAIGTLGENMALKRVGRIAVDPGVAGGYVHAGGKLGVVVAVATEAPASASESLDSLVKDLSMHVAAVDPTPVSIDRDGVPAELVAKEREILTKQAQQSGKPENVIEKMVEGRLNKFFAENCLVEQAFVKDPDRSVAALLKGVAGEVGADVSVASFLRFKLGEAGEE